MAKITLNPTVSGYDLAKINDNFVQIADHLNNKVLYRNNPSGEPNALITPLDTNGLRIYNLPAPTDDNDAARKIDADGGSGGSTSASSVTLTPYSWVSATNVQTGVQQVVDRINTDESTIGSNTSRITAVEGVNTTQNSRLTAIEAVDVTQTAELANHEGRITTLEGTVGFDGDYNHLTNKPPLTGGTTNQVLAKISNTDYDFGWTNAGAGGAGTVTNTSGPLTASQIIVGNGTTDVKALGSLGTTTTVLHGNASGPPTFGAVSLTADVSGTLPLTSGGTGGTTAAAARTSLGAVGLTGAETVAGAKTFSSSITAGNGNLILTNAAGTARQLAFQTAGSNRWIVNANNTAEGGSNAGSDFRINAYDDTGTLAFTPLAITRSTGAVAISSLTLATALPAGSGGTGVANTGTITVGGNFAMSGAFASTFTITGITAVTFPTTGTLATLAGTETFTNKTLTSPTVNGGLIKPTALQEAKVAMAALNIDLATGNLFSKTISGASTLTVSSVPTTGTAATFILDLTNGGSAVITWWSGVKWAGGVAPTLTTAGRDVLGFFTHDGGTTWSGLVLGKDVK